MTDLRKAAEMALEALETIKSSCREGRTAHAENEAAIVECLLRQALAQPEQEPVACIGTNGELMWLKKPSAVYSHAQPLYTSPPALAQPEQEPAKEIYAVLFAVEQAVRNGCAPWEVEAAFEKYEAKRKEKNT